MHQQLLFMNHASKKKITFLNVYVSRILKFGHLFMKTPENSCKQTRKTRNKRMDKTFQWSHPTHFSVLILISLTQMSKKS